MFIKDVLLYHFHSTQHTVAEYTNTVTKARVSTFLLSLTQTPHFYPILAFSMKGTLEKYLVRTSTISRSQRLRHTRQSRSVILLSTFSSGYCLITSECLTLTIQL